MHTSVSSRGFALMGSVALAASSVVLVAPSASADDGACYEAATVADVSLTNAPSRVREGRSFNSTAKVTLDGRPAPTGTVTFTYGGSRQTDEVTNGGVARVRFVASSDESQVRATFASDCATGGDADGVTTPEILGTESEAPAPGNGGNPGNPGAAANPGNARGAVVLGTEATTAGVLADTGLNTTTELVAAGGLAMVALGGAVLVLRRRGSHA